jgi:antitoxin ParD1/3/4
MSKNTSVSLGNHFQTFIANQISDGRYDSASEVIRAGLRLLENHEARMAALRAEQAKGVASDFIDGFDFDGFIEENSKAHPKG